MADNTLLNLAKQGKPGAIAAMLNRSFQKEGWTCKGRTNGNELKLVFEGENPPQLEQLRDRLLRGLQTIKPIGIEVIAVESRQTGQLKSLWKECFYLTTDEAISELPDSAIARGIEAAFQLSSSATKLAPPAGLVYDPDFAIKTALRLHKQAQSIIRSFSILGAFLGFFVGAPLGGIVGPIGFLFFGAAGVVGGWVIGHFGGMSYSLSIEAQSQLLYVQIQTEMNTRSSANA